MAGRDKTGRFQVGESGNPGGRPRGSRNATTKILASLVDGEGELIVRKLIELAKGGEPIALRLAVERLLPRMERRVDIDLPRVDDAAGVAGAVATLIELAADGSLTIEEAGAFLRLLEQQRKTIETSELADRLRLLEEESKKGGEKWD